MSNQFGKIQVYTGDGKGKTTAALGLAIRALGQNKKVAIIYFDKGGEHYGERKILDKLLGDGLKYYVTGQIRFDSKNKSFRFGVEEGDKQEAERGLKIVADIFKANNIDLLILDEINSCLNLGLIDLEKFIAILAQKPAKMELVLTGRGASEKIMALADLVTEMKPVKHYYYQGQEAREGIEY